MRSFCLELGTVARHAPDLPGHCQRCPASFYRENCNGGGSSSESTDVDNTTNGDTENQNSDEVEGGETGDGTSEVAPLSDDAEAEGAAQPADDGANDENAIAPAADGENTDLNSSNIYDVLEREKKWESIAWLKILRATT